MIVGVFCPAVISQELFDEVTVHEYVLAPLEFEVSELPVNPQTGGMAGATIEGEHAIAVHPAIDFAVLRVARTWTAGL